MTESVESFDAEEFSSLAQNAYDTGHFLEWISDFKVNRLNAHHSEMLGVLTAKFNSGKIDIIGLMLSDELKRLEGFAFFELQNFFVSIIPDLEVSADCLMGAICHLVECGGDDLAASEPNSAFREWLVRRPDKTLELCSLAKDTDNEFPLLTFVLEARATHNLAKFHEAAIEILNSDNAAKRSSAITALSRTNVSSEKKLQLKTIEALHSCVVANRSENEFSYAVGALLDVFAKSPTIGKPLVVKTLEQAQSNPSASLHFGLARSLAYNYSALELDLQIKIIEILKGVDPKYKGTLDSMDQAFSKCINAENRQVIADCIERLLGHPENDLDLATFDSFVHKLTNAHHEHLNWLVLYWLRFGKHKIRSNLSDLFRGFIFKGGYSLKLPIQEFSFSDDELRVLCERAIGYFLIDAVTAASIIVSCLRHVKSQKIADAVSELLFDPLLINYSSSARDYLDKVASKKAKNNKYIKQALARHDEYLAGLRTVKDIPELSPSPLERQIQAELERQAYAVANKAAEQHSVLLSIVTRQLLLHGEGSASYIRGHDGKLRRQESYLSSHGVSMEFPRLQNVDPIGFQHKIIRFRNSKPKK